MGMGSRPFMWYLTLNVAIQYSYAYLTNTVDPVLNQFEPHWLVDAWYITLVTGCMMLFVGSLLLERWFFGLWVQRVGALLTGLLSAAYTFLIPALLPISGFKLWFSIISLSTFSAACILYFFDVGRHMRNLANPLPVQPEADESP